MNEENVILNIDVKYKEAFDNVVKYKSQVDGLRASNVALKKELKDQKISQEEYNREVAKNSLLIKDASSSANAWDKVIQASIKTDREKDGSLVKMRSELSLLKRQYVELGEEERNSAKGKELQGKIKGLSDEIKGIESDLGDFHGFVGSYKDAITEAAKETGIWGTASSMIPNQLKPLSTLLTVIQADVSDLTTAYKANSAATAQMAGAQKAAAVATNVTSAALKILKIALISTGIGAIVVLLGSLVAYFTKTQKGVETAANAMAKMGAFADVLIDRLSMLGGALVKLFSGDFKGAMNDVKQSVKGIGAEIEDEIKKAGELSQMLQDIRKTSIMLDMESSAKRSKIKALNKIAEDTTKSEKERLEAAREAYKIENELLDKQKKNKQDAILNTLGLTKMTNEAAETMKQLAEGAMSADDAINSLGLSNSTVDDLEKFKDQVVDYYNTIAESEELQTTLQNKINTIHKDGVAKVKDRKAKELEAIKNGEDAAFALVKDGYEKQRQAVEQSYSRQIEDLKTKLATEENLTKQAKEAINQTIITLEEAKNKELKTLSDSHLQEQLDKEVAILQLKLEAVKNGTKEEFALRQKLLESERQAELEANRQLAEEKRMSEADINAKYDFQAQTLKDEQRSVELDKSKTALENEFAEKLLKLGDNMLAEAELKHEYERAELDRLLSLDEEEKARLYGSEEAYTAAVLAQTGRVNDAKKLLIKTQQESVQMQLEAARTIGEGFASVLDTFAEDSEALAAFSKTVALFNIGIATAEAIAKGVASAQAVGFPLNIPAIATTIAAVMSNIGRAKQLLSKEKEPKAPKFAEGGDVIGGSHANGGVLIEAEGGEAIINKNSMSNPLLRSMASAINVAGGGVPFANAMPISSIGSGSLDMSAMKEMFAEVIREMPTPVVSVVEITDKQNRVKAIENQSTL